jgi:hypothetical protein
MKKTFYNKIDKGISKPHAPYIPPFIYKVEDDLDQELLRLSDYEHIDDTVSAELDRHDVLIYRSREGVFGDFRWDVPELQKPDLLRFKASMAREKTLIYMNLAFDDPQAYYVSFKKDVIFCDNFEGLLQHPLVDSNIEDLYKDYINGLIQRVGSFDTQMKALQDLKRAFGCTRMIVPLMYLETFRQNGLKDFDNIFFVNNSLPISNTYLQMVKPRIADRSVDCCISGSNYHNVYPYRYAARKILSSMHDIVVADNTDSYHEYNRQRQSMIKEYESDIAQGKRKDKSDVSLNKAFGLVDDNQYQEYMSMLQSSKIFICCSSIFGYPLKKFWEGMAMGCVVVGQMPKYADAYGIVNGVHMIDCPIDDLEQVISHLLRHPDKMDAISRQAILLTQTNCSPTSLAQSILAKMG